MPYAGPYVPQPWPYQPPQPYYPWDVQPYWEVPMTTPVWTCSSTVGCQLDATSQLMTN